MYSSQDPCVLHVPHLVYIDLITLIVKEDETDGTCSTHERDEKCVQNFGDNIKIDIKEMC